MDAVVCNCLSLVLGGAGGQDQWVREVLYCATFFYTQDGIVACNGPECLQKAFDTLTRLFDRVGLRDNVSKTVAML